MIKSKNNFPNLTSIDRYVECLVSMNKLNKKNEAREMKRQMYYTPHLTIPSRKLELFHFKISKQMLETIVNIYAPLYK